MKEVDENPEALEGTDRLRPEVESELAWANRQTCVLANNGTFHGNWSKWVNDALKLKLASYYVQKPYEMERIEDSKHIEHPEALLDIVTRYRSEVSNQLNMEEFLEGEKKRDNSSLDEFLATLDELKDEYGDQGIDTLNYLIRQVLDEENVIESMEEFSLKSARSEDIINDGFYEIKLDVDTDSPLIINLDGEMYDLDSSSYELKRVPPGEYKFGFIDKEKGEIFGNSSIELKDGFKLEADDYNGSIRIDENTDELIRIREKSTAIIMGEDSMNNHIVNLEEVDQGKKYILDFDGEEIPINSEDVGNEIQRTDYGEEEVIYSLFDYDVSDARVVLERQSL